MKSAHKPQPKTNDLELAHIPEQLKKEHGWVNWRLEQRDGKPAKVPVDPRTGKLASCRDPNTWGTFAQAVKRLGKGGVSGIAFQLKPPFVGVDLDLCRSKATGEVEPWAEQIVDSLDSYSELSPSGQGIHVLVKGALPKGRRRKGRVEMYDRDRYFTLTGEHI